MDAELSRALKTIERMGGRVVWPKGEPLFPETLLSRVRAMNNDVGSRAISALACAAFEYGLATRKDRFHTPLSAFRGIGTAHLSRLRGCGPFTTKRCVDLLLRAGIHVKSEPELPWIQAYVDEAAARIIREGRSVGLVRTWERFCAGGYEAQGVTNLTWLQPESVLVPEPSGLAQ
jgi:hypothetical protein